MASACNRSCRGHPPADASRPTPSWVIQPEVIPRFLTVLMFAGVATGCVYRVADIPTVEEFALVREPLFIHSRPSYGRASGWSGAARLAADLEQAGFASTIVSDLDIVPDGAAVIEGVSDTGRCFAEPLLTILSIGVIPHIGCAEFGHSFNLYRKGGGTEYPVDAQFTVNVMVGWLTWPAALSRSYAYDSAGGGPEAEAIAIRLLAREVSQALASSALPVLPASAR